FSLLGDQIWQASVGIGTQAQETVARGLTTWMRSGFNWVTGTIDPKRIEQFRALSKQEKLHIAGLVLEGLQGRKEQEIVDQYRKDLLEDKELFQNEEELAIKATLSG